MALNGGRVGRAVGGVEGCDACQQRRGPVAVLLVEAGRPIIYGGHHGSPVVLGPRERAETVGRRAHQYAQQVVGKVVAAVLALDKEGQIVGHAGRGQRFGLGQRGQQVAGRQPRAGRVGSEAGGVELPQGRVPQRLDGGALLGGQGGLHAAGHRRGAVGRDVVPEQVLGEHGPQQFAVVAFGQRLAADAFGVAQGRAGQVVPAGFFHLFPKSGETLSRRSGCQPERQEQDEQDAFHVNCVMCGFVDVYT